MKDDILIAIENQECGIRHRFDVHHRDRTPNFYPGETERFVYWCQVFDEEGMAPMLGGSSAGNLSFRTPNGFMITPSRSKLKTGLKWTDLIEVVRCDYRDFVIHVLGNGVPSSDSFLHDRVYAMRPDVQAVFHGHDDLVLKHAEQLAREFPIVLTGEARIFGTLDDAQETADELGGAEYIIRLGHGFVSVARDQDLAGKLAVAIHRRALQLDG